MPGTTPPKSGRLRPRPRSTIGHGAVSSRGRVEGAHARTVLSTSGGDPPRQACEAGRGDRDPSASGSARRQGDESPRRSRSRDEITTQRRVVRGRRPGRRDDEGSQQQDTLGRSLLGRCETDRGPRARVADRKSGRHDATARDSSLEDRSPDGLRRLFALDPTDLGRSQEKDPWLRVPRAPQTVPGPQPSCSRRARMAIVLGAARVGFRGFGPRRIVRRFPAKETQWNPSRSFPQRRTGYVLERYEYSRGSWAGRGSGARLADRRRRAAAARCASPISGGDPRPCRPWNEARERGDRPLVRRQRRKAKRAGSPAEGARRARADVGSRVGDRGTM